MNEKKARYLRSIVKKVSAPSLPERKYEITRTGTIILGECQRSLYKAYKRRVA